MLRFKELELVNFRSWEHLKLTDLDSKGLTLIQGTNGAGKSSIRQAIEYLLLDKISDGLPLPELPRNKNTECILRGIILKDDDVIEIKKYRNSPKNGNKTILTLNDKDHLTATDRRITQKNIEILLDINEKTLAISTIFSQNSPSFPEAKESERKQLLYDALGLHKYEPRHVLAKKICKETKGTIDKNDTRISFINESLKEVQQEIKNAKHKNELFEDQKKLDIAKIQGEKEALDESEFSDLEKELLELPELKVIPQDLEELRSKRYEYTYEIKSIKKEIEKKEEESQQLQENICPILNEECSRLEIIDTVDTVEVNSTTDEQFDSKLDELDVLLSNIDSNIESVKTRIEFNKNILLKQDQLIADISAIKHSNIRIREKRVEMDDAVKNIKESDNPWGTILKDLKDKITTKTTEIKELIKSNKQENVKLKYYSFWKEGYSKSGLPNLKVSGYLESIESKTNEILGEISNSIYVSINDQSETSGGEVREKIDYQIHHPDKEITDFHSYSGGEKQRIKLADIFTFSNLIGKFNFLFLDEVLELSLDDDGKDSVIQYLIDKSRDFGSIFVISHDDSIKTKFKNVLTVTKTEGVSKLNERNYH